jgi:hypothetical protein
VHQRAQWRVPPWGTQRRTRHRRITTVSSTSGGFHRRRRCRRLLRGRHAAGRGTTFGAGCAARRAASAPSPPHLHSTRARSAPSIRALTVKMAWHFSAWLHATGQLPSANRTWSAAVHDGQLTWNQEAGAVVPKPLGMAAGRQHGLNGKVHVLPHGKSFRKTLNPSGRL